MGLAHVSIRFRYRFKGLLIIKVCYTSHTSCYLTSQGLSLKGVIFQGSLPVVSDIGYFTSGCVFLIVKGSWAKLTCGHILLGLNCVNALGGVYQIIWSLKRQVE